MKQAILIIFILLGVFSCSKKVGTNPDLAYSDNALFDSTHNSNYNYYQNNPGNLLSGTNGPHGTFKLRFNTIAYNALTSNGKLPLNSKFPEGSFLVKDVYKNGVLDIYAYMYKRNGDWLWGEVHSDGKFIAKIKDGPSVCAGCHSQSGNRDQVLTFNFY
ncbi:MAG: hypothetical protein H0W61_08995 [Bacteroidetes bacterium]|nr:hypothetical protein [Bacteroidota bacterium]